MPTTNLKNCPHDLTLLTKKYQFLSPTKTSTPNSMPLEVVDNYTYSLILFTLIQYVDTVNEK